MATRQSSWSPGVYTRWLPNWSWKLDTPKSVPAGARISAGKFGSVEMSLPAHAASVVNCSPVTCMPSPESPANRITARFRVRRGLATVTAGVAVSLMMSIVLSVTAVHGAERPGLVVSGNASPGRSRYGFMLPKPLLRSKVISPRRPCLGAAGQLLEFEELHLRRVGEVAAAACLHEHHVLDAHRPTSRVVETRLDCHHVVGLELVVEPADARQLVDVETDAVTGAVEEPLVSSAHDPGGVAAGFHRPRNLCMDGPAGGAVADQLDAPELRGQHGVVDSPELVGGLALDHRARHVREIVAGRGAREDVEDDPLVWADGPGALVVGVDPLVTAGDDGVLSDAIVLHQGDVDDLLEVLRGERAALPDHLVIPDHALPEHVEGGGERALGVTLRLLDGRHLLGRLDHPLREERLRSHLHPDAPLSESVRRLQREVCGHLDLTSAIVLEDEGDGVGEARLGPALFGLRLPLGERQNLVHLRLLPGPIDLQVRHEENFLPIDLREYERIGGHETAGVIEIRVELTGGDDQRCGHTAAPRRVSYRITGLACWLTSSRLAMPSSPRWKRYSTCAPASSRARSRV